MEEACVELHSSIISRLRSVGTFRLEQKTQRTLHRKANSRVSRNPGGPLGRRPKAESLRIVHYTPTNLLRGLIPRGQSAFTGQAVW